MFGRFDMLPCVSKKGNHTMVKNQADQERTKITPKEVARRFGVSVDTVMAWIRSGELRAINASARHGIRSRYRIDVEDLERFELSREVAKPRPVVRRRRFDEGVRHIF